ncbi:MAG: diacylglycerol kinase family protein [Planctomycetota bacterium]
MRIGMILNPYSKKNKRDPKRKDRLREILGNKGILTTTQSLQEIRPALEHFIQEKVTHFLSDGGDGTFHWVVNILQQCLEDGVLEKFPLCLPTNSGTMNCANNKVKVLGTGEEILMRLLNSSGSLPTYSLPTLQVDAEMVDGTHFKKICFAGAVLGIGPNFFEKYYRHPNRGPATMVAVIAKGVLSMFFNTAIIRLIPVPSIWKNYSKDLTRLTSAKVFLDEEELPIQRFRIINVGAYNQNFANIIRLFQFGKDGKMHCQLGYLSMFGVVANIPNLVFGRKLFGRQVWDQPGLKLECLCLEEKGFLSNWDGEVFSGFRKVTLTPGRTLPIPIC